MAPRAYGADFICDLAHQGQYRFAGFARRFQLGHVVFGHAIADLDQGRPMEIDALVGSVQELGRVTGVATPAIDAVLALVTLRARGAGLYSG